MLQNPECQTFMWSIYLVSLLVLKNFHICCVLLDPSQRLPFGKKTTGVINDINKCSCNLN